MDKGPGCGSAAALRLAVGDRWEAWVWMSGGGRAIDAVAVAARRVQDAVERILGRDSRARNVCSTRNDSCDGERKVAVIVSVIRRFIHMDSALLLMPIPSDSHRASSFNSSALVRGTPRRGRRSLWTGARAGARGHVNRGVCRAQPLVIDSIRAVKSLRSMSKTLEPLPTSSFTELAQDMPPSLCDSLGSSQITDPVAAEATPAAGAIRIPAVTIIRLAAKRRFIISNLL
ncbi:hypothetical protein RHCRD62_10584 [Rhodococcus sp. RD6.2]|nr:hypothetical protein RHCRD62_10584 [Rhodococcus sp. RD6.2]